MKSTLLLMFFYFLCVFVEESSTDGITYKTPCCSYYNHIPDIYKKTPDFIEANGFIAETHSVTTEDGYILTLHRIPETQTGYVQNEIKRSLKPAVLFQHGIGGTSDNWLLNGQKSFPVILAKAGYDVWLGDSRGNNYSKRHVKLSVNDPKFWDFSFHEQGYYDLAALTNYILRVTGQQKIFFIGHSRGTTMAYVLLSNRPEFNRKFHLVVSFAPVVYLKHSRSPVLRAVFERTNSEELKRIARNARAFALPGINPRTTQFRQIFCGNGAATQPLCLRVLFLVAGFDYELINNTMVPLYATHYPDGGALKEYLHYIQIAKSDKFRQYDYGAYTNMWFYGQQEPPEYDLNKITAPISLHYGSNDYFVSPEDLEHLNLQLRSVVARVRVPFDKFNHIDFLWATKADDLVYKPTLRLMNSFVKLYRYIPKLPYKIHVRSKRLAGINCRVKGENTTLFNKDFYSKNHCKIGGMILEQTSEV